MRKEKHYIVSAFCFEEAQPHVVYNESSFNQGMLGEGGHALFLLTLQTDTLRELFGESRESFAMYVIAK